MPHRCRLMSLFSVLAAAVHAFSPLTAPTASRMATCRSLASSSDTDSDNGWMEALKQATTTTAALVSTLILPALLFSSPALAVEGATGSNAKLLTGGASTLQSGRTISITRGVNLDNSDFSNQNLKGVAFQQSIVRDANFRNSNLLGASFFDATLDGSNFENADMTNVNIEMAQLNRVNMHNAIAKEMYVSGATLFEGITDIEGSDWSDTYLRADQQKYLCSHPTAKGVNPKTGVSTRESLMCVD